MHPSVQRAPLYPKGTVPPEIRLKAGADGVCVTCVSIPVLLSGPWPRRTRSTPAAPFRERAPALTTFVEVCIFGSGLGEECIKGWVRPSLGLWAGRRLGTPKAAGAAASKNGLIFSP